MLTLPRTVCPAQGWEQGWLMTQQPSTYPSLPGSSRHTVPSADSPATPLNNKRPSLLRDFSEPLLTYELMEGLGVPNCLDDKGFILRVT